MKIDLVIPPSAFLIDDRAFPFLGPLQIAAVARDRGHEVRVHDLTGYKRRHPELAHANADVVFAEAREELLRGLEHGPEIIGFYSLAAQHPHVVKLLRAVKEIHPKAQTVIGGPHANTAPQRCVEDGFDWIVVSDQGGGGGEPGFIELLERISSGAKRSLVINNRILKVPSREGVTWENDKWPLPARDLIDLNSYHYSIEGEKATSLVSATGCPFACSFCVSGDSFISTDRGFERISDLISGEAKIEQCMHGGEAHVHPLNRNIATAEGRAIAEEVVYEGVRPVFEVLVENGLKIKATKEHPFLSLENGKPSWKKLSDLKIGDWLILKSPDLLWPKKYVKLENPTLATMTKKGGSENINPHPIRYDPCKTPSELTEDVAWLIGFIIGDGCIPSDGRAAIHVCVTPRVKKKLKRIVLSAFGTPLKIYDASNTNNMQHGWIHHRAAYQFFTDIIGMTPGHKLHVPHVVRRSPRTVVEAFLEGLFAADGYFPKNLPSYLTTASWDLAREVANLSLMLGKVPSIQVCNNDLGYGNGKYYRVSEFLNDRIPTERAIYRSSKSGKWYWRTPRSKCFLGVRRRTLIKSGLEHPLNRPDWHYVRVEAIAPGLPEPVYDLRVPGEHCFLVDGIVVHNCSHWAGYRKLEAKSSKRVSEEIREIRSAYSLRAFMFYDDEINLRPDFTSEFLPMLRTEGVIWRAFFKNGRHMTEEPIFEQMAASGCVQMCTGGESANAEILKAIKKGATLEDNRNFVRWCVKYGIHPKVFFQVGLPGETPETIEELRREIKHLVSLGLSDFDVSITTPYEGTPIYEHPEKHNIEFDKSKLDFSNDVVLYKGIPGEYKSYVSHARLSAEDLVTARQLIEDEGRKAAGLAPLIAKDDG